MTVILSPLRGQSDERFNSGPPGKLMVQQMLANFHPFRVKISTLPPLSMLYDLLYHGVYMGTFPEGQHYLSAAGEKRDIGPLWRVILNR